MGEDAHFRLEQVMSGALSLKQQISRLGFLPVFRAVPHNSGMVLQVARWDGPGELANAPTNYVDWYLGTDGWVADIAEAYNFRDLVSGLTPSNAPPAGDGLTLVQVNQLIAIANNPNYRNAQLDTSGGANNLVLTANSGMTTTIALPAGMSAGDINALIAAAVAADVDDATEDNGVLTITKNNGDTSTINLYPDNYLISFSQINNTFSIGSSSGTPFIINAAKMGVVLGGFLQTVRLEGRTLKFTGLNATGHDITPNIIIPSELPAFVASAVKRFLGYEGGSADLKLLDFPADNAGLTLTEVNALIAAAEADDFVSGGFNVGSNLLILTRRDGGNINIQLPAHFTQAQINAFRDTAIAPDVANTVYANGVLTVTKNDGSVVNYTIAAGSSVIPDGSITEEKLLAALATKINNSYVSLKFNDGILRGLDNRGDFHDIDLDRLLIQVRADLEGVHRELNELEQKTQTLSVDVAHSEFEPEWVNNERHSGLSLTRGYANLFNENRPQGGNQAANIAIDIFRNDAASTAPNLTPLTGYVGFTNTHFPDKTAANNAMRPDISNWLGDTQLTLTDASNTRFTTNPYKIITVDIKNTGTYTSYPNFAGANTKNILSSGAHAILGINKNGLNTGIRAEGAGTSVTEEVKTQKVIDGRALHIPFNNTNAGYTREFVIHGFTASEANVFELDIVSKSNGNYVGRDLRTYNFVPLATATDEGGRQVLPDITLNFSANTANIVVGVKYSNEDGGKLYFRYIDGNSANTYEVAAYTENDVVHNFANLFHRQTLSDGSQLQPSGDVNNALQNIFNTMIKNSALLATKALSKIADPYIAISYIFNGRYGTWINTGIKRSEFFSNKWVIGSDSTFTGAFSVYDYNPIRDITEADMRAMYNNRYGPVFIDEFEQVPTDERTFGTTIRGALIIGGGIFYLDEKGRLQPLLHHNIVFITEANAVTKTADWNISPFLTSFIEDYTSLDIEFERTVNSIKLQESVNVIITSDNVVAANKLAAGGTVRLATNKIIMLGGVSYAVNIDIQRDFGGNFLRFHITDGADALPAGTKVIFGRINVTGELGEASVVSAGISPTQFEHSLALKENIITTTGKADKKVLTATSDKQGEYSWETPVIEDGSIDEDKFDADVKAKLNAADVGLTATEVNALISAATNNLWASGVVVGNDLVLTEKDGGTVNITLPAHFTQAQINAFRETALATDASGVSYQGDTLTVTKHNGTTETYTISSGTAVTYVEATRTLTVSGVSFTIPRIT